MNIADWIRARQAYANVVKSCPDLGLTDSDPAYWHFMRRHGEILFERGIVRKVGRGKGTYLAHKDEFPPAMFELLTRGVSLSESG